MARAEWLGLTAASSRSPHTGPSCSGRSSSCCRHCSLRRWRCSQRTGHKLPRVGTRCCSSHCPHCSRSRRARNIDYCRMRGCHRSDSLPNTRRTLGCDPGCNRALIPGIDRKGLRRRCSDPRCSVHPHSAHRRLARRCSVRRCSWRCSPRLPMSHHPAAGRACPNRERNQRAELPSQSGQEAYVDDTDVWLHRPVH